MKRFFGKIALFGFIILALVVLFNIVFDPYAVIRGDLSYARSEPNQRYLKVKHVVCNPNKCDSYVFGSSRVGKIDTRNIHDGYQWYNMSYSVGLPVNFREDLSIMIKNNVAIKNVAIGIEDISYLVNPRVTEGQLLRKTYVNWYNPLYEYLLVKPSLFSVKSASPLDTTVPYTIFDVHNSGVPIPYKKDEYINTHKQKHIASEKFTQPTWGSHYYNQKEHTVKVLKDIYAMCMANKINCIFFIIPMHCRTYAMQNIDEFNDFLREIGKITTFYDFSGINDVTTDNFCYYETSHFRPFVGDKMIDVMFHHKKSEIEGFGELITKENIDLILDKKQKEFIEYQNKIGQTK